MIELAPSIPDVRSMIVVDDLVTQCCWCGAFKTFMGYRGHSGVVTTLGRYRVSHGACPDCYETEMAKIRRGMRH